MYYFFYLIQWFLATFLTTMEIKYYKEIHAHSENSEGTFYAFRRTIDNNPDYLISSRNKVMFGEYPIVRNENYGTGRDWTSDYNYYFINGKEEYYFYCRLQGWDYIHPYSNKKNITTPKSKRQENSEAIRIDFDPDSVCYSRE